MDSDYEQGNYVLLLCVAWQLIDVYAYIPVEDDKEMGRNMKWAVVLMVL
jgi:hypothetical protein